MRLRERKSSKSFKIEGYKPILSTWDSYLEWPTFFGLTCEESTGMAGGGFYFMKYEMPVLGLWHTAALADLQ